MKGLTDDEFFGTEVGTGVEDGALTMGSAIAQTAAGLAQNFLSILATSPDFLAKMQVAFGNSFDVEKAVKLASAWAQGDFSDFPEIEIRSAAEINGALGAFAAATGKIYLSREFLAQNAGNVTAVAGVLLEEFGHFVDSQINSVDAIGDEGEIFSDVVQGKALSQGELAALKGEDDSAIVVLDGVVRAIEQAELTSKKETLDFFAGEIKEWGGGSSSNRFEKEIFKERNPEEGQNIGGNVDNLFIKYDWDLQSEIKASIFATPGNYGEAKFSYPVDLGIQIPKNVEPGETFSIIPGVGSKSGSANFDSKTRGFELPNAGIKLELNLIKAQLENVAIKAPWRTYELPISVNSSIGQGELSFDLIKYPQGSIDLPGGTGKISVSTPKIKDDGIKPATARDQSDPVLPDIAASGRSNSIIELEADFDKLFALTFPPLAILGNEVEASSPDGRVKAKLSYDLLDLKGNLGLGLQQDFTFDPEKIEVTMSLEGQTEQKGTLGSLTNKFEFQAPSQGSGMLKVKARYELFGNVKNNIGAVIQGSINAKALQAGTEFEIGNFKGQAQFGPLLSVELPKGGAATDPFPLIGSPQSKPTDPKPQFPILRTIEISGIGGVEQDDKNPQPNPTKNLIIEKEYEIPYNLPYSISDARADEGENLVFTVSRNEPSNEPVFLVLEYENDTAKAGEDYFPGQRSVTIPAGQVSADITVPTTGDEKPESTETFKVKLKKSDGSSFATNDPVTTIDATGIIIDDDKPDPKPENRGSTWGEPHLVTIDGLSYNFQTAGEFMLLKSESGDLEVQTRQEPFRNEPVSINTAIATKIDGQRITIFRKPEQPTPNTPNQEVFINDQPTQIADNSYLSVGQGRIYHQGDQYTIVYASGDQIDIDTQASFKGINYLDINIYLTKEREGKITGLFGNNNNKQEDDIALRDGTILQSPVSANDLYGKYADSWRIKQEESLFHYEPGQSTNTFTNQNFPRNPITIEDLQTKDPQKFEEARQKVLAAGITDENLINAALLDFLLTGDESFIESAKNARTTNGVLALASPFAANSDFTTTTVNTATKIDVLANDSTVKDPLSIKEFNPKSVAGGTITLDNNNTPDDKTDDQFTYTPPPNFTGNDKFNYLLTDGQQIQAATVTVNINNLKLANLNGENGFTLNGTEAGNFSGVAVSKTGDINGDQIGDIAIGSFGADPNNINAAGKSQVVFGNQKFPATIDLSQLDGQNGFTLNGTDAEGFSGGNVSSAGDINGDGIKDFIIGAFGAAVNGQNNAGKAYIVFGSNQGFPANFNLSNLNGNNGFAITGTNAFDYAGLYSSGIGDINGDRIDDLLISAPGPLGGTPGKSYVIYGRTTGFSSNLNLAEINGNNGFVINGIDGNSSGTASSGDINGDGITDLVIGADGGTTNGGINAGKTYVILGQQGGFTGSVNVPELNGTTGFVIAGLTPEERSGIAITAEGDINGDGNKDIVIGAPGATVGDQINAGKTYVILGKKEGFPVILNPAELNGSNGFTISGFDIEGSAGNAVSYAGDINKDGFDDLLIGASGANSDDKNNAGKTFVVFGKKEFPANFSLAETNGNNALVLNGVETDGLVGTAVSGGGDINGDGIDDIIVGAPGSLFNDSPGKSYAIFGSRGFGFANPNDGLQGTVQDDIINGTQADDTISGRQGNDKIFGNSGQDVLSGNLNDDYLDGEKGQDIVLGGDGNDSLVGGLGNDAIKGDSGNDILTGVDINAINPGIEEIDTLTGGGGSDIFVLGDANNTYYDNLDSDYALITDFNASEDSIQLQGKADDYLLVPFSQTNQTGTAIYRKAAQNELISILQGGTNLSLTGNYFSFVGAG